MPKIYRASSSFVLFSRGEGFGLPYCEASLCGLPIIGTNYSGHTMFLNKNNSYLLDIDELDYVKKGTMNVTYWDGQKMPKLNSKKTLEKSKSIMRYVYKNYKEAKNKNIKLRKEIMSNYNIERISNMVKKRLLEIIGDIK